MTLEAVGNHVKKRSFLKNKYWKKSRAEEGRKRNCMYLDQVIEAPVLPEAKAPLNYLVMFLFFLFLFPLPSLLLVLEKTCMRRSYCYLVRQSNVSVSYLRVSKIKSSFILLHMAVQFSQHHLLSRLSFPYFIFLVPLL